jgi:protein phosphatase
VGGGPIDILTAVTTPTDIEARRSLAVRAWGATDKGRVRRTNEDCFRIDRTHGLLVLADGMGGHNAGDVASRLAADTIVDLVRAGRADGPFARDGSVSGGGTLLRNAIHAANRRVLDAARDVPDYSGMGTTIVAVLARGPLLSIAHAGDSRCYVHDGARLRQVTVDDSWLASVLASDPGADPVLLQRHPLRNTLTNVVGLGAEVHVHLLELPCSERHVVVLTSDGVHGVFEMASLERLVGDAIRGGLEGLAGDLVALALDRGSRDNCTAVVAEYLL